MVDRNLVQVARRSSDGKGVKTCQIHDLFSGTVHIRSDSNNHDNNTNNARRLLSFPSTVGSYTCSLETCNKESTHSLFFYEDARGWLHHIPGNLRVNVLYFSKWARVSSSTSAEYLKSLTPLRYLKMEVEFDGLCDFHNLETLHVLYTSSKDLRIGGLKQLRHLHCEFLVKLLIDEQEVKDKMQNLQTLCYVIADSKLGSLLGNAYFPNLRTLGLYITAYQDRQATEAEEILKSLHCLRKLRKVKLTFAPFGWVPLLELKEKNYKFGGDHGHS
ncbi:hypothetical protein S83_049223 [Arachis hypogaea]